MRNCSRNGNTRVKVAWLLAVLLAGIFCSTSGLGNNGYLPIGYGTSNTAMAGAGMALPEEAAAVINNPATALAVAGHMQAGISVYHPRVRYSSSASSNNGENGAFTIGPNDIRNHDTWVAQPYFATSEKTREDSAIAVALYTRAGMNAGFRGGTATIDASGDGATTYPGTYGDGDVKWRLYQTLVDMSWARQLSEKIAFGVSGVLATQSFKVNGLGSMAPFTETYVASGGSVMPANLSGNGNDWTYGGGFKLGLHAQWSPAISVGLMYQSKIWMGRFRDYADLLPENGSFDMPADLKIGITWRVLDKLAFSIDAEHIFHGDVAALSNPVQNQFSCGTADRLSYCLGGDNGSGLGWDSVTVYKLGGQWGIGDKWTLRAGFSVTDQPIAADQVTNNLLTQYQAEAHYTLGFSRTLGEHAALNFSAYYSEEESKVSMNVFDPGQNLKIESDQLNFELSYSWRF